MAASLWNRCGGASHLRRLETRPWRVVESQSVISTRKIVDSVQEQELIEQMIDGVKPPLPPWPRLSRLHYLLYTPFRHPPLRHGSRFGTRFEPGIWYGSRVLRTAFAEVAYYRLLFLEGSEAELGSISVELSAFRAQVRTRRAVDLTRPPFAAHAGAIGSRTSYRSSQALGRDMRAAGVEAFVYLSARDRERGANVGLFVPVFSSDVPSVPESWVCTASQSRVELVKKDVFKKRQFVFQRDAFEVDGRLPAPSV